MRYTIGQLAEIIDGDRGKNYPKQDEFYPQGYDVSDIQTYQKKIYEYVYMRYPEVA